MDAPKLFISYSWSNQQHEQWVIDLATHLIESGVNVILDKWDLKEGHDAVAFMEKMVTDPEIKKVLLVCDELYSRKADGRAGGVGTETQIISKGIYDNVTQDKFVAVISEKDNEGKAFLPTYYKSRIFIDLSEADTYAENFEKLLRWIFDKPLYQRPELGIRPSFLTESPSLSLGTTTFFRRCLDALKNNKSTASGALEEYFDIFAQNIERFRLPSGTNERDNDVLKNIEDFIPFRNEAVSIFTTIAQYSPTEENIKRIHRFFENLIPYMSRPAETSSWNDTDYDNYRFLIHEMFLYLTAIMLKHDRIEQTSQFLQQKFYVNGQSSNENNGMVGFPVIRQPIKSLNYRNQRLNLRRLSVRADLLKERATSTGIEFRYLMQADFVAFMRAEVCSDQYDRWWPETLVYLGHFHSAFEIFARSSSKKFFDRTRTLLSINSPLELKPLLDEYKSGQRRLPSWDYESFRPEILLGYEQLATSP